MATIKTSSVPYAVPDGPFPAIPAEIDSLLLDLHVRSRAQELAIASRPSAPHLVDELMADKFIALDRDKCLFAYQAVLASGATRVVELGTSYGVSTIYLALAVAANARRLGVEGRVVATEKEPGKAQAARGFWAQAGPEVERVIDLRLGNLEETLKEDLGRVDFVLLDIWQYVALPALKLVMPALKDGAVVLTDNTISSAKGYRELLQELRESGRFSSVCIPYEGGFEFSIFSSGS